MLTCGHSPQRRNCPNWKELHRLQYIVGYKGAEIRSKNVTYTHLPESLGLSETPRQCGAPTQKPLGIGHELILASALWVKEREESDTSEELNGGYIYRKNRREVTKIRRLHF